MLLVIGASGFIGSKLFRHFQQKGVKVKGTYYTKTDNMPDEDRIYLDLNKGDGQEIIQSNNIKYILLCHGISNIDQCKRNRDESYRVNVENTIRFLNNFAKLEVVPIYLSTDMVYNGKKQNPTELDEPEPITEYGRQKAKVEDYVKSRFSNYIILRLTKVFGVEKGDKTIFTSWMDRLLMGEKILSAYDSFISPVCITDVVEAIDTLMDNRHYGIYNLGGHEVLSVYEFSRRLAHFFYYDVSHIEKISIRDFNFVEQRPEYNSVDSTKIKRILSNKETPYENYFKLIGHNYET